jgi:hypothetical protein
MLRAGAADIWSGCVLPGPLGGDEFVTRMSPSRLLRRQNQALATGLQREFYLQNPICRRRDSNLHGLSPTVFKSRSSHFSAVLSCSEAASDRHVIPAKVANNGPAPVVSCSLVVSRFLTPPCIVGRQLDGSGPYGVLAFARRASASYPSNFSCLTGGLDVPTTISRSDKASTATSSWRPPSEKASI